MADRLVEVVVGDAEAERVERVLDERDLGGVWRVGGGEGAVFRALVRAEAVEELLDALGPLVESAPGARLVVLPVEASLPRPEPPAGEGKEDAGGGDGEGEKPLPGRISREELYQDLEGFTRVRPAFLATAGLSALVAAIGLARDNPAVVIGAMVIAPLLGPNMALALATTLGDGRLAVRSLRANALGFAVSLAVALAAGLVWAVDVEAGEVSARTTVSVAEIALALASGTAGALATTAGVATSIVGVMVAVALLPPLVAGSMLLVRGHADLALHAFLLLATNVVCINLASVATFYVQGVQPRRFFEAERSRRASRWALAAWLALLVLVAVLVLVAELHESTARAD